MIGGIRFFTQPATVRLFQEAQGYVAILQKDAGYTLVSHPAPIGVGGMRRKRAPELRSSNNQIPYFNILVTWGDFSAMLQERSDAEFVLVDDPRESFPK
jgi:hypothetical protein